MDLDEAKRRDQVLRDYFEGRDWDGPGEFQLKRLLAKDRHEALAPYPFLVDDEWEVSPGQTNKGRGDLVFTDGQGRWATVETKWIDGGTDGGSGKTRRRSKTKKRRKVEDQALEYASLLAHFRDDVDEVQPFRHTNEQAMEPLEGSLLDEAGLRERFPEVFATGDREEALRRIFEDMDF